MCITVIVFGLAFYLDRQWLPNPYFNYLSWSYGLAVVSGFFSVFQSIAHVTYVMIIHQEMREPPRQVALSGYLPPGASGSKGSRTTLASRGGTMDRTLDRTFDRSMDRTFDSRV